LSVYLLKLFQTKSETLVWMWDLRAVFAKVANSPFPTVQDSALTKEMAVICHLIVKPWIP
jgi:hypothetical protein